MPTTGHWVLFAYKLPREPSSPRIALWRKLRRLGAAQIQDGLVALPLDARNREQVEWMADEVLEAGGSATVWIAQAGSVEEDRALIDRMRNAVTEEYRGVIDKAEAAGDGPRAARLRVLRQLRRDLHAISARDHFPPPEREAARQAVAALAERLEVSA